MMYVHTLNEAKKLSQEFTLKAMDVSMIPTGKDISESAKNVVNFYTEVISLLTKGE